jgi:hypothetical protein
VADLKEPRSNCVWMGMGEIQVRHPESSLDVWRRDPSRTGNGPVTMEYRRSFVSRANDEEGSETEDGVGGCTGVDIDCDDHHWGDHDDKDEQDDHSRYHHSRSSVSFVVPERAIDPMDLRCYG